MVPLVLNWPIGCSYFLSTRGCGRQCHSGRDAPTALQALVWEANILSRKSTCLWPLLHTMLLLQTHTRSRTHTFVRPFTPSPVRQGLPFFDGLIYIFMSILESFPTFCPYDNNKSSLGQEVIEIFNADSNAVLYTYICFFLH